MIITNERQYKITKAQIERLQDEMTMIRAQKALDPPMMKLQEDSHKSLIDDLVSQIREYEKLRSGTLTKLHVNSFLDLPKLLIRARVARGWTQRDLAQRLNLHEQKIQQYEADEYSSASFKRLYDIVQTLEIEVTSSARFKEQKKDVQEQKLDLSLREQRARVSGRGNHKRAKSASFSHRSPSRQAGRS